ncbi:endoglucanase Acf2 [Catenuloplanes nepalensis]|uniref:glucan endo-1,3-beta-D-glucosidase n=1 Tax=Catenuloplanes nepalensis TaxID=587533 RepID=A0ABT9MJR8_9ACTN|nr:glycosyl hydrolase [Catenuloplanes nepalensis]MDP9791660.1 endoglucanase Acf2 [Catenuloplanes nepalensis]
MPVHRSRRRSIAAGAVLALMSGLLTFAVTRSADAAVVGAGSYTETPPAGAALPSGCGSLTTNPRQYVTGNAPSGAVPTNDWWSSLLFKRTDCAYSEPLHAHPLAYDTLAGGLGLSYTTTPAISGTATGVGEYHYPYVQDLQVGVAGLNSPDVRVDGWSDWTVTPYWSDGTRTLRATIGHGLPFSYYQVTGGNAQLTTAGTPGVWSNSGGVIGFTAGGSDYVAYAPSGATWAVSGTSITSSLAGRGYFSVAVLPTTSSTSASAKQALASSYGTYAHAHVTGTRISYTYSPSGNNALSTTYAFTTTAREGSASGTVVSLYPHQWKYLSGSTPIADTYVSARGAMKVLTGVSSFRTAMTFRGVLPEIPGVANTGADLTTLNTYLNATQANPEDNRGPDTYWTGKGLGRAARIAEIADQVGNTAVRGSALAAIKSRLTNWLTASSGESQSLFYYNANWGTLIGYPASYGSDQELNDHHFHYGYYVAAAATLARFDPAWASNGQYGGMIDLLIRDANNYDRNDTRFPYLRDFDIYAGHDWASGHGSFGSGNNQESSSEGQNFASALIQWGQVTGNTAVRDAGVFLYTTQAAAIQEYWFDSSDTNFPAAFGHSTVGMVWGSGGAYATWFSAEPEMIQGINMLPITGGHLYLGYNPSYVNTNYAELVRNNGGAPTVWQDILWEFQALGNPDQALANFRANSGFTSEEGESKAHTFHWLRNLAALGTVDTSVSANHPLTATFVKNGARTYVASNINANPITVTFSTGTTITVPAGRTVTTGAWSWTGGSGGGGTPQPTTPAPTTPPPTTPPPVGAASRYLISGGGLSGTAAGAGTVSITSAGGGNHDGTPRNPVTFTATGVSNTYTGGSTAFDLFLDAGTNVGNGTQVRVSYDLTGDGSFDRVETYRYFATDPVGGYEHYTQAAGLASASGTLGNLRNGTIRVEVWSAIGNGPTDLGVGNQSIIRLPLS